MQEQVEPEIELERDAINNQPLTLNLLVKIVKKIQKLHLSEIEGKEVIICLGLTGCGKSTMLTSLVYGPGSLEEQRVE